MPGDLVEQLQLQAEKLGKTRSALIKDILADSMKRTREAKSESEEPTGRRIDENACVRRLLADSEGIGFDMEGTCAKRAVTRGLTGEEWDVKKYPKRLKMVLMRQKENDDYWGENEDNRYNRLNNFAETVGIEQKMVIALAKELEYVR